jgi:hypothetical protein
MQPPMESITELPATYEELARLKGITRQTVRFLDHTYKLILDGPENDEANVLLGTLGITLKNMRIALVILNNSTKRDYPRPKKMPAATASIEQ